MTAVTARCLDVTVDAIKALARDGVLGPYGNDTIRGVSESSVQKKMARTLELQASGDRGLSLDPLPAVLVTHVSLRRPASAGDNDFDDGVITQVVQIVDRLTDIRHESDADSYLSWQEAIREKLQTNPYRSESHPAGNVFNVHVTDQLSSENRSLLLREARLVLQVSLYVRTRRDETVTPYDN